MSRIYLAVVVLLALAWSSRLFGEDWPMFRHDRSRTAVTDETLALPLEPAWTFRMRQAGLAPKFRGEPTREITPDNNRWALPLTAAGDSVFFTTAADGRAVCLDAASGKTRWEFTAGGAVNRAPTFHEGKLYFGSDDGFAYCLDAQTGAEVWKYKAAPADRWLFSYGQLSSVWPVRTDVLVDGGVAYFGAGIFPHDGTFLYALDAGTGKRLWRNDTHCENNSRWPLSPNGHLYATKAELYVPMDLKAFRWATFLAFRRADGLYDPWASKDPEHVRHTDGSPFRPLMGAVKDGTRYLGNEAVEAKEKGKRLWSVATTPYTTDIHSVQGMDVTRGAILRYDPDLCSVVYAGGAVYQVAFAADAAGTQYPGSGAHGKVFARDSKDGKELWSAEIAEWPNQVIVANGRLLVGTRSGVIHCFAPKGAAKQGLVQEAIDPAPFRDAEYMCAAAESIVRQTAVREGYALVLDCRSGSLAQELARRTNLQVCAVFADAAQAQAARKALVKAGTHLSRVQVWHQEAGAKLPYPSRFADLVVSESAVLNGPLPADLQELDRLLKPIRGVALVGGGKQGEAALRQWIATTGQDGWQIVGHEDRWAMRTQPPLKDAGGWTHAMGNAGNTMCSNDAALKPPLGVAWYGPPQASRDDMGDPPPLISAGVLVCPDQDKLAGYDEYTGRRLWRRADIGPTDAAASGDSVYLRFLEMMSRLDLLTGRTVHEYKPPFERGRWDDMAVSDDGKTLYGAATSKQWRCLVALDVATGKPRWTLGGPGEKHQWGAWRAISDGRMYTLGESAKGPRREEAIAEMRAWLATQGKPARDEFEATVAQRDVRVLTALDAASGRVLYEHGVDLSNCGGQFVPGASFGSSRRDSYNPIVSGCVMAQGGTVIFATESGADKGWGVWPGGGYTPRAVAVHDGATGKLLWHKACNYRTRPVVAGGYVYAEPWAYDLHSGAQKTRIHPVTGEPAPWAWCRNDKQCGVFCASTNFLFGRSRGVGYQDLLTDCGLYTFMDSRASCWVDTSSGGGMMIKPPFAIDCLCEISMPFAVAFCQVPTAPAEPQVFAQPGPALPVKHLYLDFGATGDRRDKQGNLWLSSARPKTPPLILAMDIQTEYYQGGGPVQRSAEFTPIADTDVPFVFASAARGLKKCVLPVTSPGGGKQNYLLRLGFSALPGDVPRQRVFDVRLNGRTVLVGLDIAAEAGKADRALWKEFLLPLEGTLTLELVAKSEKPAPRKCPS